MKLQRLVSVAALLAPIGSYADSPLPQASLNTVCSASGSICAESNPQTNSTKVFNKATGQTLWSMAGWHRWMFLSEDGRTVVVGYD
jgi:hypothetical protein